MPKRRKRKRKRIPANEIVVFPNKDKENHERWNFYNDGTKRSRLRHFFNIPAPYTCCIIGKKNLGKTNLVKNILLFTSLGEAPFEEMFNCHPDPESQDYEDISCIKLTKIPDHSIFNRKKKSIIVIDDIDVSRLSKGEASNLNRMFGYTCSHRFLTVILNTQTIKNIDDAQIRRMTDIMIIGDINDPAEIRMVSNNIGVPLKKLKFLIKKHLKGTKHNVLIFDTTKDCPFPIRCVKGKKLIIIEKKKN